MGTSSLPNLEVLLVDYTTWWVVLRANLTKKNQTIFAKNDCLFDCVAN